MKGKTIRKIERADCEGRREGGTEGRRGRRGRGERGREIQQAVNSKVIINNGKYGA